MQEFYMVQLCRIRHNDASLLWFDVGYNLDAGIDNQRDVVEGYNRLRE